MELLDETFDRLSRGEVIVPTSSSPARCATTAGAPLRLGKDEIAIFEGIHALNDDIAGRHPEATGMYISARSNILEGRSCASRAPGCASPAAPCGTTISAGQTCWKRC